MLHGFSMCTCYNSVCELYSLLVFMLSSYSILRNCFDFLHMIFNGYKFFLKFVALILVGKINCFIHLCAVLLTKISMIGSISSFNSWLGCAKCSDTSQKKELFKHIRKLFCNQKYNCLETLNLIEFHVHFVLDKCEIVRCLWMSRQCQKNTGIFLCGM